MPRHPHFRRRAAAAVVTGGVLLLLGPRAAGWIGSGLYNGRVTPPPAPASPAATRLHSTLRVSDLHSDALLWGLDLTREHRVGHADLPRLREGRVAVQVFSAVTRVPLFRTLEGNDGHFRLDAITGLTITSAWPPRTWTHLVERALYQSERLEAAAARSDGLSLVRTREGLEEGLARGPAGSHVSALLAIEGAHALEGEMENLYRLHDAGYRMIGLTHFFDNRVGGSAHGKARGGLTGFGREVLGEMERLGMLVDVAHASPALIEDVAGVATKPIVVSHSGVRGTCDNVRNLSDRAVQSIAETGGVIGIGLWGTALCGESPDDWARAVRYVADLVGAEHAALGSDWDGSVRAIVDAAGTDRLVDAMLRAGFTEAEVRLVMGENVIRVLRATLPSR